VGHEEEIDTSEKLLLRVFFHVHGDKVIMLLEGYDKGAAPSSQGAQTKIANAQKRLQQWKTQPPSSRSRRPR
jgi:hypothetical protein